MIQNIEAKSALLTALLAFVGGDPVLAAAQNAWQPSPGHTQIQIWPGAIPDAQPLQGPERSGIVRDSADRPKLVGGKPWVYVDRVARPTMTVYSPSGPNT